MTIYKQKGFTLIEMLVVLVILSMTTVLLAEGLGTTWRNFERLGSRDLTVSSAQLPVSWFAESIRGAVLYHPEQEMAEGDGQRFEFHTFKTPSDDKGIVQKMEWMLTPAGTQWSLIMSSEYSGQNIKIATFSEQPAFEYFHDGQWQAEFAPAAGLLPKAVRIKTPDSIWAVGKIGRPERAEVPPELAAYGKYEF